MPHRRADTNRQVRRRVWVADREGANLPYSKGSWQPRSWPPAFPQAPPTTLPSSSSTTCSHWEQTASMPTCSRASRPMCCSVTKAPTARRYLAWRAAKRSPRPIVVLIGGATGVGKSTVATKLAARLGITRVIPTDTVREVMRTFMPAMQAPELHSSSFEVGGGAGQLIDGFLRQSRSVAAGSTVWWGG